MPKFEVMYKVIQNDMSKGGTWISSGPSHYTIVVDAPYQGAAAEMVQNMNGGPNHCQIIRCMHIGN